MRLSDELRQDLAWETILGQVVSKANNYQAVPDGKGGRRIIKSDKMRNYERRTPSRERLTAYRVQEPSPMTTSVSPLMRGRR